MQVKLSSQNREIISHGTVFLFDENGDLTLNIDAGNSFELVLTVKFSEDISQKRRIETDLSDSHLKITCINFVSQGTGLTAPLEIAIINGKKYILCSGHIWKETQKIKQRHVK